MSLWPFDLAVIGWSSMFLNCPNTPSTMHSCCLSFVCLFVENLKDQKFQMTLPFGGGHLRHGPTSCWHQCLSEAEEVCSQNPDMEGPQPLGTGVRGRRPSPGLGRQALCGWVSSGTEPQGLAQYRSLCSLVPSLSGFSSHLTPVTSVPFKSL